MVNETALSWIVAGVVSVVVFGMAWLLPAVSSWVWFTVWLGMWFIGFNIARAIYWSSK